MMLRKLCGLAFLVGVAVFAVGCSGGSSEASNEKPLEGTVDVNEMPAGSQAPGDVRPGGGSRDGEGN